MSESTDTDPLAQLIGRAAEGDETAWGQLLVQHEDRLLRLVQFRVDPQLRGRVDPADVIQESFLQATKRRDELFANNNMTLFVGCG